MINCLIIRSQSLNVLIKLIVSMFIGVYILILLLYLSEVNVDNKIFITWAPCKFAWCPCNKYINFLKLSTFFQHPMVYFMYRKEGIFARSKWGLAKLSDTISDVVFCCCKLTKMHPLCVSKNKKKRMHNRQN